MVTTPGAIRDRMVTLIKSITPSIHAGQKFQHHRAENTFRDDMEAHPASCLRKFSVRNLGDTTQAAVTSNQLERVEQTMLVEVAYSTDWRHGGTQLLGLDDVISSDEVQLEAAIGVAASDSTLKNLASILRSQNVERELSGPCVFLTLRYQVEYARSLA